MLLEVEGRISTAIRVKPGDPIIGRLCCMVAVRDAIVDAASSESKLYDGFGLTCTEGHAVTLAESLWQSK